MQYQGTLGDWICNIEFKSSLSINDILDEFQNCFIIFDNNVKELYFNDYQSLNSFTLESSESNKSFETYLEIINQLEILKLDKSLTIIGIGGGIVCDIAGFVAATYKRGTNLALIPTSLLAMVDAAIGGKNSVNFNGIKNLVGTIRIPDTIYISPHFLETLDYDEILNGIAEIIKISIVYDHSLFNRLENLTKNFTNFNLIKDRNIITKLIDSKDLQDIIVKSVELKMKIVEIDNNDSGIRKILNFGHTLGHAIEAAYKISHGKSVVYGIYTAAFMSLEYNMITDTTFQNIFKLFSNLGFDLSFQFDFDKLMNYILNDKKRKSDYITEILINDIGKYEFRNISVTDYRKYLNDLC